MKLLRIRSIDNSRHRIVTVPLQYRGPLLLAYTLFQLVGQLLDEHMDTSRMAGSFAVYSVIRVEGRTTPSRLAAILGMPPTSLSYVLRQMENRGHLRRRRNPDDGRSFLIELTARGRQVNDDALGGFATAISKFRAELDVPEPDVLRHLEAMAGALERSLGQPAEERTG